MSLIANPYPDHYCLEPRRYVLRRESRRLSTHAGRFDVAHSYLIELRAEGSQLYQVAGWLKGLSDSL